MNLLKGLGLFLIIGGALAGVYLAVEISNSYNSFANQFSRAFGGSSNLSETAMIAIGGVVVAILLGIVLFFSASSKDKK